MAKENYSIVYSSRTGNTKKLAATIHKVLPSDSCFYYGTIDNVKDKLSNIIYIGFWTERGNADSLTIEFLKKLKNKKIFLFGTAGYGGSEDYFRNIINNVKKNIDSSNILIGTFMCQGKMPLAVKERYENMAKQNNSSVDINKLIRNFEEALSHPDVTDLERLKATLENLEEKF